MTIDSSPLIRVDQIREALPKALEIIDQEWLLKQRKRRSAHIRRVDSKAWSFSRAQNLAAARFDHSKPPMHPIAECLLAAQQNLEDVDRGMKAYPSEVLLTRVLSLRDIALARNRIPGLTDRLHRIFTDEWKPALYELLTAVSYPSVLAPILLSEDGSSTVPDISLSTNPSVMVECKARLRHEQETEAFVAHWRRSHLSQIVSTLLSQTAASHIVRVEVKSISEFRTLPDRRIASDIDEMLKQKRLEKEFPAYRVSIELWETKEITLSQPIPTMAREFWQHGWGFAEWDEWHYILPHGDIGILDSDRRLAIRYQQRAIICVRANELKTATPTIVSCIKDACRRQLANSSIGIIHILLTAAHFGLGKSRNPLEIARVLDSEISKVFNDYSRLWRIYIDITSSNDYFHNSSPSVRRIIATNRRGNVPKNFQEPSTVLLV
jgi:hypothetical protein